jgi:protein-S-isoprenylcysteine O-methyltransferase Ste14
LGFLSAFLVGTLVQHLVWPQSPASPATIVVLGVVLVGVGVAIAASAIVLFATSRTTVVPHGQPTKFVVRGPFRWTRNPMYVGLTLAYTGAAAWTGKWLALPFLALPIIHLTRWVIPMEEAALRARFGQAFEAYSQRVRRWL